MMAEVPPPTRDPEPEVPQCPLQQRIGWLELPRISGATHDVARDGVWATRRTAPGMCACGRIGCARGIGERSQRLSWWSGQTAGADPWLLGHAADLGAGAGGIGALSRCACREPGGPRRWARDGRHARFGERAG